MCSSRRRYVGNQAEHGRTRKGEVGGEGVEKMHIGETLWAFFIF